MKRQHHHRQAYIIHCEKASAEDDELAELHSLWLSMPFMYGFTSERHLKEIDCMLEKKYGVRRIHILRIIGLMEGDFNVYLKWAFNQHVMLNAEESGNLSPHQWGGQKGRSAIACAFRKLITWEYFRIVKETVVSFPGDLQSNFDRMLPSFNSIFAMKNGLADTVCRCRAETVERFERPVKTAAGVSQSTYKYEDGEVKMGGEVQGKPDNMQLWTITSSYLLNLHNRLCQGVTLVDPTKQLVSKRTGDAYVDDKDSLASAPITETAEEGAENIEKEAQMWSILISLVGQAFAFHKCFWQMLSWMPIGGYFMTQHRRHYEHLDVWIKDHRGRPYKIQYKHHDQPNEGLGVKLCPSANQRPEFEKRLDQAKTYAKKVQTTRFYVHEAWTALKMNVLPSITYSFPITRFTKAQLLRLSRVLDNVFLPELGVNRKMKRIAVYAPLEYGGINYPCIETIQDQKGIGLVMRQLQWGKDISHNLRILIQTAQLESGMTTPILDDTTPCDSGTI